MPCLSDDKVVIFVQPKKGKLNSQTMRRIIYTWLCTVPILLGMSWALFRSEVRGTLPWLLPLIGAAAGTAAAAAAAYERNLRPDIRFQPLFREPDYKAARDVAKEGAFLARPVEVD